jgi:ketosteroid isomerase-like protein
VATSNIEIVRTGLDAMKRGDLDAVVALLDENVRWDGVGEVEPCLNRDQAAEAMRAGMASAADLELADAVPFGTDKVMVCLVRLGAGDDDDEDDGPPSRLYNVVTFEGERIVRMQGFLNRREAVQAARGLDTAAEAANGSAGSADAAKGAGGSGKRRKSLWRRARMGVGRALGRG